MALLLYCTIAADGIPRPLGLAGIHGAGVSLVRDGGIAAVVSEVEGRALPTEVVELSRYERVIAAIAAQTTTIPMRYGAVFDDEASLRRHLGSDMERYLRLLERLDGCVELGLRAILSADSSEVVHEAPPQRATSAGTASGPGRAYLLSRSAQYGEDYGSVAIVERSARAWGAALAPFFVEARHDSSPAIRATEAAETVVSMAFLVRAGSVQPFRNAVAKIMGEVGASYLLSGPWAPWSFVAAESPI